MNKENLDFKVDIFEDINLLESDEYDKYGRTLKWLTLWGFDVATLLKTKLIPTVYCYL